MDQEIDLQELLQAVASLAGQQFVNTAVAEAGRMKALREIAALQDPSIGRLRDASADG